jgi:penicillin-binding protein 2
MIEKYLTDSIAGQERKARLEQVSKLNLLPARMVKEMRKRDSIIHARDSAYLIAKGFIREVKDTLKLEDEGVENEDLEKLKNQKPLKNLPAKDSRGLMREAILPNDAKRTQKPDSSNNNN